MKEAHDLLNSAYTRAKCVHTLVKTVSKSYNHFHFAEILETMCKMMADIQIAQHEYLESEREMIKLINQYEKDLS